MGPVVLVWDNLNTHVSQAMRELIAARDWLTVYRLPPYAPELNPVEGGLVEPETVAGQPHQAGHQQLTALIKTPLRRMQYRAGLLDGFLTKTGLDLGNLHN